MIAITGSTGFIGTQIYSSIEVPKKCLVRQRNPSLPFQEQLIGDLLNSSDRETFVKDSDTVLHLAWVNNPWTSNDNVVSDVTQNLLSSIALFESFAKSNPGGHLIFSSSGGNMYKQNSSIPHRESDLPAPWTSYSINKLAAENYLKLFCKKYGIRATVLRISNPYGILLPSHRSNGLIGVVFSKLLKNETLNIIDSLHSVRDYIHLNDLARAIQLVIQSPPKKGHVDIYNVSTGHGSTLKEILHLVEAITKRKISTHFVNADCEPSYSILSAELIQKKLGWLPKICLEEGLNKMWMSINT